MHFKTAAFAFAATLLGPALGGYAPASAQLDTQNLVPCAQDGEVCRMPHPTNVYYGIKGKTNGRPFPQGGTVPCNVGSFGDPAPGVANKMCWYAPKVAEGRRGGRDRGDDGDGYRSRDRDDRGGDYRDRRDRDDERPRARSYDDEPRRRYDDEPRRRSYEDDDRPRRQRRDLDD
ncbi:hypothetical protein [Methylobacterium sp. Leaf466]|uniref:hypothetical protein n=1 Tax=Methylobacterium sp. Leaf466 TaxID=1736386 RepID=UPI0009E7776E|nr:hypothetical protein [Methylobacterium sp. Leaf466]